MVCRNARISSLPGCLSVRCSVAVWTPQTDRHKLLHAQMAASTDGANHARVGIYRHSIIMVLRCCRRGRCRVVLRLSPRLVTSCRSPPLAGVACLMLRRNRCGAIVIGCCWAGCSVIGWSPQRFRALCGKYSSLGGNASASTSIAIHASRSSCCSNLCVPTRFGWLAGARARGIIESANHSRDKQGARGDNGSGSNG